MSSDRSVVTTATMDTALSRARGPKEIRSRFMNRLGIYDGGAAGGAGSSGGESQQQYHSQPMSAAQHRRVRILRGMGVGYTVFKSPPDGSAVRSPLGGAVPSKGTNSRYAGFFPLLS